MAGTKKSKRSKDTGSPNIVLVLFLITFVIATIAFGLLWYFSLAEKDTALKGAAAATKEKTAAQTALKVYQTVTDDFSQALGRKLTGDEIKDLDVERTQLMADNSAYGKGEKNIETYRKQIEANRTNLGFESGEYKTTYEGKYKEEAEKAEKYLADLKKAQADLISLQGQFKELQAAHDKFVADLTKRFDNDQKVLLRDANKQTDEMTKLIQVNTALNQNIVEQDQLRQKIEKGYKQQILNLKKAIEDKETDRPDAVAKSAGDREPHALMLDISLGKPLWDDPVGRITRVDTRNKEVTINLGSANGVKPDLTFAVFAPSKYIATRAEKQMKGSIEVIRILGPHAALARITATFDPEFAMHDGDLLFNMFWGTHVAVTGYPSITGIPSESPSEQQRQLSDFLYLLARQGIIVDAHLDLTDGQVKGTMTNNTRFLIRGDDLAINAKDAENKEPRAERAVAVNNAALAMRKDAIEKGMFIISARNFATAIGYRTGNAKEQVGFEPKLPTAGSVVPTLGGGVGAVGGVREAPMPMPEPKEKGEPKEKN